MSKQKQKWTAEEEQALYEGVHRYGSGKWKLILLDPEFGFLLSSRSNVDLKDKWRNLGVSSPGSTSRLLEGAITTPPQSPPQLCVTSMNPRSTMDSSVDEAYEGMIHYAISDIKDPNGSNLNTIYHYMLNSYDLPGDFNRKVVTSVLTRLVSSEVLEKVNGRYKIRVACSGAETSQHEVIPRETLEDVSLLASFKIGEAEEARRKAIEANEKKMLVAALLETSLGELMLAKENYDQCVGSKPQEVVLKP